MSPSNHRQPQQSDAPLTSQGQSVPSELDWLTVPNVITISRLVLAVVLFWIIDVGHWWLMAAVAFAVAAVTDALDGYIARSTGRVTVLGRILDPFADKFIIIGTFVFLLQSERNTGVNAWMVLIIIARELLVTSLRGYFERQIHDFSADWVGKAKMILQCVAVTVCLLAQSPALNWPEFLIARDVLLWVAVAVTFYSGVTYVMRGIRIAKMSATRNS